MPLTDQWQGFAGLPNFGDPSNIPTNLKAMFDFLGSRAVPRYASVAARDAELPAPAHGQVAWVDADATLYLRAATGWRPLWSPPRSGTLTLVPDATGSVEWTAVRDAWGWDVEIVMTVALSGGIPVGTNTLTDGAMPADLRPSGGPNQRRGLGYFPGGHPSVLYAFAATGLVGAANQSGATRAQVDGQIRYRVPVA